MQITSVINTHGNYEVTMDTVRSVYRNMTEDILLVIDGAALDTYKGQSAVAMLSGFYHNCPAAPYKNVALGLKTAWEWKPNSEWICYLEYDCLLASSSFKENLVQMARSGVWCLGSDLRRKQDVSMELAERFLKVKFSEVYYLLGAVMFFHRKWFLAAEKNDFFNKFLVYTNDFQGGFFPGYNGYDLSEHLLPTLAVHWGGNIGQLSRWDQQEEKWAEGNYKKYPIRWRPDLTPSECAESCICHPIKDYEHPTRQLLRSKRAAWAR